MTIAHTSTPVVVLRSPHHGGLGVTRSLGRLGIPVFNVDSSRWAPAFFSRYCKRRFVWNLDEASPEESVTRLLDIARQAGRRCILLPTTDTAAMFVADHSEVLKSSYITPAPSRVPVHSLCSKKEMHNLAKQLQIATPRTFCPENRDNLVACIKRVDFPAMVKAMDGQARSLTNRTKWLIRSEEDVAALCNSLPNAAIDGLIVQEYIPGGEDAVWIFNGYFNARSECLIGFTGRKLRQCPVYTGVASFAVCQKNRAVKDIARKFMKAAGYRGIVDMDFRYDARDGQYKLLDVNPRIGSTFRLFVSEDGMDVARALYLDLTHQPVAGIRAPEGRKWFVEDLDLMASFGYRRDGKLTLRQWLASLRGIRETAFFSLDDLLPFLLMLVVDVKELWSRAKPRWEPVLPFFAKHRATDSTL